MLFEASSRPRVFGLAPGVDFPAAFARGLVARMAGRPPEDMARVRIFVNSGRMLRSVREALERSGTGILPRLAEIGAIGALPVPGIPPAVGRLARKIELSVLVSALSDREPTLASDSAVFHLADNLTDLIGEMQGEGVSVEALADPGLAGDHAQHWERSLAFVRIAARFLASGARPDQEGRFRRAAEAMVAKWAADPPADPVIVAGSTGSRGTTALVMGAVARLPQGAVVLPGFDFEMSHEDWRGLTAGETPHEDHPQYRQARVLASLGLSSGGVTSWSDARPHDIRRNRLVSLALASAPTTDRWIAEGPRLGDLEGATGGVELIEAESPSAEARAIAFRIRAAIEERQTVAVVTPDRRLARRLTAALARWGITPDDSAGEPLSQTPPGRLLRLVAGSLGGRVPSADLLSLLKHPLAASGGTDRRDHLLAVRGFERWLRREGAAYPTAGTLAGWASENTGHAAWAGWVSALLPPNEEGGRRPLSAWVEDLVGRVRRLADGPSSEPSALWQGAAGQEALAAVSELRAESANGGSCSAAAFRALVDDVLAEIPVHGIAAIPDPRVRILGTIEARGQTADVVIAAGLNEGTWPAQPVQDGWMSRQMRQKAGLLLPERRIGLAAHDFQQAVAAPWVVLSRSRRDEEAETIPSRWLARLLNLLNGLPDQGGRLAIDGMLGRGRRWLDLARKAGEPGAVPRAHRPAPRPPVAARPRRLPVTSVRNLILDPYAIYARRILCLDRLDPLRTVPDGRDRGTALHRIVEEFVRTLPDGIGPDAAEPRLRAIADEVLAKDVAWPTARVFWRTRIGGFARAFAEAEVARRATGAPVALESDGSILIDRLRFTLTAKADRIDLLSDGRLHIFDYKSGQLPAKTNLKSFELQLGLEAAMAERGGWPDVGTRRVARITYLALAPGLKELDVPAEEADFDVTWARLERLIERFDDPRSVYPARGKLVKADYPGDYDHLSRFGEWGLHEPPEPEDLA